MSSGPLILLSLHFRLINGFIPVIVGHVQLECINFQQDVFRLRDVFTRIDPITLRNVFPRISLS